MSRIVRENEKYLKRVERSMAAERKARDEREAERQRRQEERVQAAHRRDEERRLRQEASELATTEHASKVEQVRAQTLVYGQFWVETCREQALDMARAVLEGEELTLAQRALRVRVYRARKGVEYMPVHELVRVVQSAVPKYDEARAQTIVGDLRVASAIFETLGSCKALSTRS